MRDVFAEKELGQICLTNHQFLQKAPDRLRWRHLEVNSLGFDLASFERQCAVEVARPLVRES
jgi:hypothetical protein